MAEAVHRARRLGSIVEARFLEDRQRVPVGAQPRLVRRAYRSCPFDEPPRGDAPRCGPMPSTTLVAAELAQLLGQPEEAGAVRVEQDLGVFVDVHGAGG